MNDQISGQFTRSWRLEAAPETQLGRVAIDGRDQFITRIGAAGCDGVEGRSGRATISADSRVTGGARLRATGFLQDVESLSATVAIPPGWTLVHATGADPEAGVKGQPKTGGQHDDERAASAALPPFLRIERTLRIGLRWELDTVVRREQLAFDPGRVRGGAAACRPGLHHAPGRDLAPGSGRADVLLPRPWMLSASLMFYRGMMLAWSLWLAFASLRWSRWVWSCLRERGWWQPLRPRIQPPADDPTAPPVV